MKLVRDLHVKDFLEHISPYLKTEATLHSFLLSLAARYLPRETGPVQMIRGVDGSGNLLIAGMQTEAFRQMALSHGSVESSASLARALAGQVPGLPGVNGPALTVDAFANAWAKEKGIAPKLTANLRLFSLETVIPARKCSGSFRIAETRDADIIFTWLKEFTLEAIPDEPQPSDEEVKRDIQETVLKKKYFLWEDRGAPVCLVGSKRETEVESWIAPVYTPPSMRGRGYASALVAAVSQLFVDAGKRGMLFTDLANPTSNNVYTKIGYKPVADFKNFAFS